MGVWESWAGLARGSPRGAEKLHGDMGRPPRHMPSAEAAPGRHRGASLLSLQEFIREGCLHKLTRKGLQQRMFFLVGGGSSSAGGLHQHPGPGRRPQSQAGAK